MGWPLVMKHFTTSPEASDSISFISFMASTMQMTWPFSTRSPGETKGGGAGRGRAVVGADDGRFDDVQAGVRIGGRCRCSGLRRRSGVRRCGSAAATERSDEPGEIGNPAEGAGLRKFQPDLDIAAIEIELGDLVFLEELDQFPADPSCPVVSFVPLCLARDGAINSSQSSIRALGAGVST